MNDKGNSIDGRGRRMNWFTSILVIVGLASLLYFVICFCYIGLSVSFVIFWGITGVAFISAGVLLSILWKKGFVWPTWIKIIVITVFLLGAAIFTFTEAVIVYYSNQSAPSKVEYLLVLGAKVNGTHVSAPLWRRLNKAADYLKQEDNQATKVIVSGGQGRGEDISEAKAMHDYLVEKGIDKSRIIMEDQSTNTDENIQFSRDIIKNDDAKIAIVSNGFHIYRATRIAKKQGMTKVIGLSASSGPVMALCYYVREGFAVIAYKLKGRI